MVDVEQVVVRFVRPGDQVVRLDRGVVGDHAHAAEPDRRRGALDEPGCPHG
jgi:hypothetical protein